LVVYIIYIVFRSISISALFTKDIYYLISAVWRHIQISFHLKESAVVVYY